MLTLASIVERETAVDSEQAKVAGVYTNRLEGLGGTRLLNADPTVIYAVDATKLRKLPLPRTGPSTRSGACRFSEPGQGARSPTTSGLPDLPDTRACRDAHRLAHPGVDPGGDRAGHEGRLPLLLRLPGRQDAQVRADARGPDAGTSPPASRGPMADLPIAATRPTTGTGRLSSAGSRRRRRPAGAAGAAPGRDSPRSGSMPTSVSGARTPAT